MACKIQLRWFLVGQQMCPSSSMAFSPHFGWRLLGLHYLRGILGLLMLGALKQASGSVSRLLQYLSRAILRVELIPQQRSLFLVFRDRWSSKHLLSALHK